MALLTPDRTRTEYGLVISEKILPAGKKPNRSLLNGKPEWITIHNTPDVNEAVGTNDAEQYARATWNGNMNGVTVHYYIDETGCWQLLREDEMGYHAADGKTGTGNSASLAVEIVMDGSGKSYDVLAEDRGALLAAILLHRHGLGIDRLTTHQHWYPNKYCPAYILPHWTKFRAKVEQYLSDIKKSEAKKTETADPETIWRVQIGAYKNKASAEALKKQAIAKGFSAIVVPYVKGDVDGDGKVTAADAREALRLATGAE